MRFTACTAHLVIKLIPAGGLPEDIVALGVDQLHDQFVFLGDFTFGWSAGTQADIVAGEAKAELKGGAIEALLTLEEVFYFHVRLVFIGV